MVTTIARDLFPALECVDCDHDVDRHLGGYCEIAGCTCAREVFDDD